MIACYKGHFDIAKYLIEITANVNRKSVKGNTALHDCAESGSLDIMKLLLDHDAKMDVDSYGEFGWDKKKSMYIGWIGMNLRKVLSCRTF